MRWHLRGLLRLAVATVIAVIGLALAFVVAPAQASDAGPTSGHASSGAVEVALG